MDWVREDRMGGSDYVWTASTLGGNPISTAAARAALDIFQRDSTYPTLHHLGNYLREGMRKILQDTGTNGPNHRRRSPSASRLYE